MSFRRALRLFFAVFGFLAGLLTAVAAFFARRMIAPPRQRLWTSPADAGLDYEEVQFPAYDGVRLSGWFIPAQETPQQLEGATVILVHGWGWNRLGYAAEDVAANMTGSTPVEFLRLIHALNREGYHVLTFDLRNHGQSAASRPVTFGQSEAKDLLGALWYLNGRSEVNSERIGVIGFSMGANALLFALPQTEQIKAAIAVQPTTPAIFSRRFAVHMLGPFGGPVRIISDLIYRLFGGPRLSGIQPEFAVCGAGETPVLYLQGNGDAWGSVEDVSRLAEATPKAQELLFVSTTHRFEGYQYVIDNPLVACAFFTQHLA